MLLLRSHVHVRSLVLTETHKTECMTGCRGFLLPSERDNIRKSAMWAKVWGPRVDAESFCNGAQSAAAYSMGSSAASFSRLQQSRVSAAPSMADLHRRA